LSLGRVIYAASMHFNALPESVGVGVRQALCIGALPGLLLYSCKTARHPRLVFEEAGNTMKGPALAAGCMAWMTVAAETAQSVQRELGQALWIIAVMCYLVVFFRSVYSCMSSSCKQLGDETPDWSKVHPGWYVPAVGVGAASISSDGLGSFIEGFGLGLWWNAMIWFLLLLPFITWRMTVKPSLPAPAVGTVGVYMAPASLCYVAWASVGKTSSGVGDNSGGEGMGHALLVLSISTWVGFLCFVPRLIKIWWQSGPNPSYASLTFPSDITALAAITAYKRHAEGTMYAAVIEVACWILVFIAAVMCIGMHAWFMWSMLCGTMLRPPAPAASTQTSAEPPTDRLGALAEPVTDPNRPPSPQQAWDQPEHIVQECI